MCGPDKDVNSRGESYQIGGPSWILQHSSVGWEHSHANFPVGELPLKIDSI